MMKVSFFDKFKRKIRDMNEQGSREAVLEDLFNDFNRNRFTIYKFNFFRGIFFGLGSVIGGTVVIALLVWVLNATGHFIPGVAGFVNQVVDTVDSRKR